MKLWSTLLAATLVAAGTPALAETLYKTVPAGRASKLDHYTGWNNDCSFMTIRIDVVGRPAHGTVSTRPTRGRIGSADIGNAGACAGKPSKVLELHYRPSGGFRGSDTVSVNMRAGNRTVNYTYYITVR